MGRDMMLIEAEDALEAALHGGQVRRRKNTTGSLRSRGGQVACGCPEVMVKITGFGKGADHVRAHLSYITRDGKLELETECGDHLRDREDIVALFRQWDEDLSLIPRQRNQRDTMHMVLSMPEGTPETAVRDAARKYANKAFGENHEYVFALHTDEPHPHVHLVVKMRGFDGKRLNPRKADLQAWREVFAQELRDQGIEAEATSRAVRGVVRKAERSVVRHIELGDERRAPRVSRIRATRVKEAADDMLAAAEGQMTATAKPWEACIQQRQELVRQAWLTAAAKFEEAADKLKEQANERPDYDKLDGARVRAVQRAAAVYQSGLAHSGQRVPAIALARMRDLSRLDVVQHQRPAQVLLHAHARDGLGRDSSSNHDLRWPRTRPLAIAAGTGNCGGVNGRLSENPWTSRTLANQIRTFVDAMPPLETQGQELKRTLTYRFSRIPDLDAANSMAVKVSKSMSPHVNAEPSNELGDVDRPVRFQGSPALPDRS